MSGERVLLVDCDLRRNALLVKRQRVQRLFNGLAANQISHQLWQPSGLTVRPAVLDRNIPALDVPAVVQALAERIQERHELIGRARVEKTDHRHARFLRADVV